MEQLRALETALVAMVSFGLLCPAMMFYFWQLLIILILTGQVEVSSQSRISLKPLAVIAVPSTLIIVTKTFYGDNWPEWTDAIAIFLVMTSVFVGAVMIRISDKS
ncbi:hypothetical protein IKG54_01095 [Candidatus Saccharibacteria bacterium]|nr:hypothetical protein [Candidatus Saccharibacteria bacterium]